MTINHPTKQLNGIVSIARTIELPMPQIIVVGPRYCSHDEITTCLDWCYQETGASLWSYVTGAREDAPGIQRYETEFYFVDQTVAMMFKLKFG